MNETLHTKWGTAKVNSNGYYHITSRKEGYNCKKLHRLIYEAYYGPIPEGYHVHHRDNDKLNNRIDNLQLLSAKQHLFLHRTNTTLSDETKQKLSEAHTGKTLLDETKQKMSEAHIKNYARIVKGGFNTQGKKRYIIRYEGKQLKQSIYLHKLYKWWGENHPGEFLYLEI